jgi:hypothetical protein
MFIEPPIVLVEPPVMLVEASVVLCQVLFDLIEAHSTAARKSSRASSIARLD